MTNTLPQIIQGGMGAGVSNWRLAKAVAEQGHMGVVSGTALDSILIRRLQQGDSDGDMRRALDAFPLKDAAQRILNTYYVEGGIAEDAPFKLITKPTIEMSKERVELMIAGAFVEVFLAKEGHEGQVGINLLEKIQIPLLSSVFGAMLAKVDAVCVGAGMPVYLPEAIATLAKLQPAEMKIRVEGEPSGSETMVFTPADFVGDVGVTIEKPLFLAVVSSETAAKVMLKRSVGDVDGLVVENNTAGGHNAPPRARFKEGETPFFSERDWPVIEKIKALGIPFWIAGGQGQVSKLKEANDIGAIGIQVGTAFALCDESGIETGLKKKVVDLCLSGEGKIRTDFEASPTGYPFKVFEVPETMSDAAFIKDRKKVCDLGYLRTPYYKTDGTVGYRCPAEPINAWLNAGGTEDETKGRLCVCNGLMSTMGLAQTRNGVPEAPLVTCGEDISLVKELAEESKSLTVADVLGKLTLKD